MFMFIPLKLERIFTINYHCNLVLDDNSSKAIR